jgi:hypothetical protein
LFERLIGILRRLSGRASELPERHTQASKAPAKDRPAERQDQDPRVAEVGKSILGPVGLLKKIVRGLVYSPLNALVGRRICVRSAETAPMDVMQGLGGEIPRSGPVC